METEFLNTFNQNTRKVLLDLGITPTQENMEVIVEALNLDEKGYNQNWTKQIEAQFKETIPERIDKKLWIE